MFAISLLRRASFACRALRLALLFLMSAGLFSAPIQAQPPLTAGTFSTQKNMALSSTAATTSTTSNPHALKPAFSLSGRVDAKLIGVASAMANPSGTLAVTGIPTGATIEKAFVYANDWNGSSSASLQFNNSAIGSAGQLDGIDTDAGYYGNRYSYAAYRWDVTSRISGNGAYSYNVTGISQGYGVVLVVVYSHSSLPLGEVQINDGSD